jgi:hypothetical protein
LEHLVTNCTLVGGATGMMAIHLEKRRKKLYLMKATLEKKYCWRLKAVLSFS